MSPWSLPEARMCVPRASGPLKLLSRASGSFPSLGPENGLGPESVPRLGGALCAPTTFDASSTFDASWFHFQLGLLYAHPPSTAEYPPSQHSKSTLSRTRNQLDNFHGTFFTLRSTPYYSILGARAPRPYGTRLRLSAVRRVSNTAPWTMYCL
jgi:hypothetical protein